MIRTCYKTGTFHYSPYVDSDRGCLEASVRTRFNKIAIPNNKFQMASGQGSHWLIESPTIFSSMCSPPLSNICQFYFFNIFTLLALTQSFGSLFHSFITLCEKECFIMSNLQRSLINAALCPLVLLPSLSLKNTFLSTSS